MNYFGNFEISVVLLVFSLVVMSTNVNILLSNSNVFAFLQLDYWHGKNPRSLLILIKLEIFI